MQITYLFIKKNKNEKNVITQIEKEKTIAIVPETFIQEMAAYCTLRDTNCCTQIKHFVYKVSANSKLLLLFSNKMEILNLKKICKKESVQNKYVNFQKQALFTYMLCY